MNSGVYRITFAGSEKRYVGSGVNIVNRRKSHLSNLNHGRHPNQHLQNAFNKYGLSSYKFDVLLFCDPENCLLYEQSLLDLYNSEKLFNIRLKAESNLGIKMSDETKRKVGEASHKNQIGRKRPGFRPHLTEEHKQNMHHPNSRPKTFTSESKAAHCAKLSATTKAYWDRRRAKGEPIKESRQKKKPGEPRKKMEPHTQEHRKNLSLSAKSYWNKKHALIQVQNEVI